MSEQLSPEEATYEIVVAGHLDESWASWFDGMVIEPGFEGDGSPITKVAGPVVDQAALHRILTKLADLGLQLRRVDRLGPTDQRGS